MIRNLKVVLSFFSDRCLNCEDVVMDRLKFIQHAYLGYFPVIEMSKRY